jgi:hypothetical protein
MTTIEYEVKDEDEGNNGVDLMTTMMTTTTTTVEHGGRYLK